MFRTTAGFPAAERFGLTSQLRRAAVPPVANVAEGQERASQLTFALHRKLRG